METTTRRLTWRGLAGVLVSAVASIAVATSAAAAPPAPAPAAPPAPTPQTYGVGATGAAVTAIEQLLASRKYDPGKVDANYDEDTAHAVTAFQKVNGKPRTGTFDHQTWLALSAATQPPAPLVSNGGTSRVEIDLKRQVLFLYEGGNLTKILSVSSGTSETPTPTGNYKIYHQSSGWETSALGRLYNSQYFVGGYAIHGSLSVPPEPASHGCVRLPMTAAEWFPDHVKVGTPVYIR